MANQIIINIGAAANDGTGDPLRTAFNDVNLNFESVWNTGLPSSNVLFNGNRILTLNTNGNLILAPNGVGKVVANVDIVPNANNTLNLGSLARQWNTVYARNIEITGELTTGDLTVAGNLTVTGNIIEMGNIVTDALTLQLANTAANASVANGAGITVGANDNIATLLYNSGNNVWTTNIGLSATGNITAPYFIGNGSQLTGITSYANANAVAYGQAGWAGNIIPSGNAVYSLGNATNQWKSLYVSNTTIYLNNVPVSLTAGNILTVNGNDVVTTNANGTVDLANLAVDDNNIYNTNGQGVVISNFSFIAEAETAYVQIPAGNSSSDLNVVQEQGNVRLSANTAAWTFGSNGTLTFPDNSGSSWPINQQRFGMGNIGAWLDGGWTIGEFSGNGVSGQVGIRIDPGVEGNTGINLPSQADSVTQPVQIYNTGGGNITLFTDYAGTTWTFDNTGALNVPNNGVIRQDGAVNIVATDYAQLQWVDSGNINIPDPNGSSGPKNWAYVDNGGFHVETNLNNGGSSYAWDFDTNGNFTTTANIAGGNVIAISNFVGANLRTNLTDFNWSEAITGITLGATTTITLANNVFGDPWSGQVTITGVSGATEANATWWYEAVDSNQFILYTDSSLSTPVDSSAWGAYVSGGFAVTFLYGNIEINAQNITIRSDHGDYNNKIWRFSRDGQTIFPYQDIVRGDTGGGNITGYAMVMGDGTNEAIISTPNGNSTYNNSQRLVINPGKGADGTGGEGGDIYLWAGRGGDTDGNGGDVKIRGGYGPGNGQGGYIRIEAGDVQGTGTPGYSLIRGGDHNGGTGGYVQLLGGYGGDGNGGYISIEGGYGIGEGGDVTIAGGSSGQGASHYGNVFVNTGGHQWKFDNTGNLTLPGGGSVYSEGFTPSGNPGNTIILNPHGSGSITNQKLMLYPTAGDGDHLHMTTGNLYQTELFLGSDDFYVKLANTGNVVVYSNDSVGNVAQWTFDTTGTLTVPGEGVIQSLNDTVVLQSKDTGTGNIVTARLGTNGGLYFEGTEYPNGWLSLTNSSGDANITAASGTAGGAGKSINITAGSADQGDYYTTPGGDVNIYSGIGAFNDGGGGGPGGNINIVAETSADPAGHAGNINFTSGVYSWVFGYDGNLTLPHNTFTVNYANGTPVSLGGNYGDSNVATFLAAYGSNTVSTTGNITAGNFIGSGSNVELVAGSYTFTFDNTGVLTLPTIGGDEGGELHLGIPAANTTLQNSVKIDVYQDRLRFFEGSANAKGAYIDLANCANGVSTAIGYRDIPQISFSANTTATGNAAGCHYYSTTAGNLALTLPDNSSVAFPTGATLTIVVNAAGNVLVNQAAGVTLYQAGSSTTGNRVVGAYGLASVMKVAANTWVISGTGVY